VADEWYYASNGQPIGPVSSAALREMAASGTLLPTALVWKEGMSQWAPASATRGLFPTPVQAQAPARFPAPAPPAPEPPPEHHPYGDDEDVAQASVPARVKRGAGGMSSGAKAAMVGGIVFVLALALMVGIVVAVLVASTPANRSYTVNLNFEGQEDIRFLKFRQNHRVQITVPT